jgi:outer membrane protein OmpA-like peptidoglycan-associated protein
VKAAALTQPAAPRADVVPAPIASPQAAPRVYAFATRIQFAWNSAQLAPAAYPLLDTLAQVLKEPAMTNKVIQIEGHTDSAGSDAYNQRLSAQRAASVQRYLHTVHGLPLSRIPAVGKGKAELYDPAHPFDAVNRRVQFVNLTDSTGRP